MATFRTRKRSRSPRPEVLQKPRGVIHPRVQKVGPEHFGIVSVDCAKARSKWMLADFYGKVLIAPETVQHSQSQFAAAIARIRQAMRDHDIRDLLIAVERTGRYHLPVKRAFGQAGFEVRIVHPFTSKQFRQPADPENKTDDTDLAAIHRAATNGFALLEPEWDLQARELQLLVRHRRDLVEKTSALQCQIREHLEAALPGYAALFDKLWESDVALPLARHAGSAAALHQLGVTGMAKLLHQQDRRFQQRTLQRIALWACQAAPADAAAVRHLAIAWALDDDRLQKERQIQALEREIASRLVRTPYILLLSLPGIHVVSAGDYAGEMGPIRFYPNARAITGRAGLYPSRYQSDRVDHADGPLVRRSNRKLRAVLLGIADNLRKCNRYFRALAERWEAANKDPRDTHVKIGMRFSRIGFQMVAGGQVFRHPCTRERSYILEKLLAFHREHDTTMAQTLADLEAAVVQVPASEHAAEAAPLAQELEKIRGRGRRGPQPIGDILPLVLARLGVTSVQSQASGS